MSPLGLSVRAPGSIPCTVIVSQLLNVFLSCLSFATGIILYAFYSRCPTTEEPFPTSDKLSLYFVLKELSSWPGAPGLCLAGLLSGALSTMSSFLNSLASVTLEDFVKLKFKFLGEKRELTVSKALTAVYGVVSTALVFATSQSRTMVFVQMTAVSVSVGPPPGIFFLGMWTKRANALGVSLGLVIGVILVAWLSVGSALYGNRHLPLPSPQCPDNTTNVLEIIEHGILARLPPLDNEVQRGFLDHLYGISFYYYPLISFLTSAIFGYLLSIFVALFQKAYKYSEDNDTLTCVELQKLSETNPRPPNPERPPELSKLSNKDGNSELRL